jgi:dTDP-4-dehydrorhamnose reductase
VNAFGPRNLAIISNELQIPLVHFSSDYVFDGKKGSPYYVWDKPNPLSVYGKSKLYGEEMVAQFTNRYFLIRLSWVFGDGKMNFVKKVIEWSKYKEELKIVDDQISSPSYTVELAKAIIDLFATGTYGIYHLSNSGNCSRYEWAKSILRHTGWRGNLLPVKSQSFNSAAERPVCSILNSFPIKETIGYVLPDWEQSLVEYLRIERFRND